MILTRHDVARPEEQLITWLVTFSSDQFASLQFITLEKVKRTTRCKNQRQRFQFVDLQRFKRTTSKGPLDLTQHRTVLQQCLLHTAEPLAPDCHQTPSAGSKRPTSPSLATNTIEDVDGCFVSVTLSELAMQQASPATYTLKDIVQLLNHCTSHPNASIVFRASDMNLCKFTSLQFIKRKWGTHLSCKITF